MYFTLNSPVIKINGFILSVIGVFLILASVGIAPFGLIISVSFLRLILGTEFIFSGLYLLMGNKLSTLRKNGKVE